MSALRGLLSLVYIRPTTTDELIAALHATAHEDDAKRLRDQLGLESPFGPIGDDGHDGHAPQLNGLLADCPGCITSPEADDA